MSNIKNLFAKMAAKENGSSDSLPNGRDDAIENGETSQPKSKPKPTKQTIEKTYQKKTQLEHILLRPDTYIGSVEKASELMWIYDTEKECMIQKKIEYVPGLYKIFDEILVNAADNKQRDKKMDCIKIDINAESNTISIWNNGKGIPVVMHKDENMFVPTMIFGHLLTSSNYNDEEEKVTGGRNGYGAKLCNIFSTKFTLETACMEYKKQFKQTWGANMTKASEPKVKEFRGDDFTKISFSPDLEKFKMDKLDDDIVQLMSRRAYDVAASTRGVKVILNGKRVPIKNFKDYVELYTKGREDDSGNKIKVVYESPNERWEVAVALSPGEFQQVSFVNSIATTKGGRHVDHVVDSIVKQLIELIKKKNKGGVAIRPFQIKNHISVFINCLIVNPTFDSQTKENMTLQMKSFGSKCNLSEKFITQVTKCGIVEAVLSWAQSKAQKDLEKTSGKKQGKLKGIPKLEDANEAGRKNALKCTLILTEGDSAKTLAISGLGVIGRDYYGVFPLRGKLLNVREATHKQILENAEINNLIKIIGLDYKRKYNSEDDMKSLRYGKVMIMTDQDQDGSHIKGLIINFFHFKWPELLQRNFLEEFITPIVKVFKRKEVLSFFSMPEFDEWRANTPDNKLWRVKYYKGLGSSDAKEAKEYFSDLPRHRICFRYSGPQDDDHIVLAFSRKHIESRKEWLTNFMVESKRRKEIGLPENYLYGKNTKYVTYTDFINLELILFSNSDNIRSIPSMCDGLKPGQRKVIYTCFKRNDKHEVKVVQLSGSVIEKAAYHHGDTSLHMTIVNLAQNFVGSNNINLLEPCGQFGTRLCGGKDSSSPRYISTKLSPLTRMLFHPKDDGLLKPEYDDNKKVEPVWYLPIIPMVLVNGADGIGTGWSTKIPNYNPREIIANIRAMLDGDEPNNMLPWYKGFLGTIEDCGDYRYAVSGEVAIVGENMIEITELPVGTWTQNYKENVLEPLLHGSEKTKAIIADYREYNTDSTVKFVITLLPGQMENVEKDGIHKVFKLQTLITTSSMCAFDELGCIRKFDTVLEILNDFYKLRLDMYKKRKQYYEGHLEAEAARLSAQARFILEKCKGEIVVENKKRKTIVDELIKRGYPADPVSEWMKNNQEEDDAGDDQQNEDEQEAEEGDEDDEAAAAATSTSVAIKKATNKQKNSREMADVKKFDYLLGMSMWMLTEERKNELLRQRDAKLTELDVLRNTTPARLWRDDLDEFSTKLDQVEKKERDEENNFAKKGAKKAKLVGKKKAFAVAETMPSPSARRIEPKIGDELKKRIQYAVKLKENKGKKGVKKENIAENEEKDEFDLMVQCKKTIKERIGSPEEVVKKVQKKAGANKGSDGFKQTKLNFPKKSDSPKKRGKKKNVSDDESSNEENFSGSDVEFSVAPPVSERTTTRRAVTKKPITYDLASEEDSDDGKEEILHDNEAVLEKSVVREKMDVSESEDEIPPPKHQESSEDMFDSLVGRNKDTNSKETKKAAPKRKKKNDDDVLNISDSDDDFQPTKKSRNDSDKELFSEENELKKKSTKKPQKKIVDSDADFSEDEEIKKKKAKKPQKKIVNSDTDSSEDGEEKKKTTKQPQKKMVDSEGDSGEMKKTTKKGKQKNEEGERKKTAKKAATSKPGPARTKKKKASSDSDEDFDFEAERKRSGEKAKNHESEEELFPDDESESPAVQQRKGRDRKRTKYVYSDDDDNDSF